MSESKIVRSNSLLGFGILSLVVGLCSFCGTCSFEGARSLSNEIAPVNYCEGASPKAVVRGDNFLLPLQTGCWTQGVKSKSGIMTVISENGDGYDVYCANGQNLNGNGRIRLNYCSQPVYFKAKTNAFNLRVVVE
jgi:hypothetical protein